MVITNAVEYRIGVKNTKKFIEANVVEVQLRRPRQEETEAGGTRNVTPDMVSVQQFRIVPMSGLVWDRSKTTPDEGNVPDVSEQLICLPDADVQKNDYFPHDGGWFKVVHVSPVRGYRREARLRFTNTEPIA